VRDTEQSYCDWTLDVFQSVHDGRWCCDFWHRSKPYLCGSACAAKRREAISQAKAMIAKIQPDSAFAN